MSMTTGTESQGDLFVFLTKRRLLLVYRANLQTAPSSTMRCAYLHDTPTTYPSLSSDSPGLLIEGSYTTILRRRELK